MRMIFTWRFFQCTFYFFMFCLTKVTNKDMSRISQRRRVLYSAPLCCLGQSRRRPSRDAGSCEMIPHVDGRLPVVKSPNDESIGRSEFHEFSFAITDCDRGLSRLMKYYCWARNTYSRRNIETFTYNRALELEAVIAYVHTIFDLVLASFLRLFIAPSFSCFLHASFIAASGDLPESSLQQTIYAPAP